jgi:heat shock protein HslJ
LYNKGSIPVQLKDLPAKQIELIKINVLMKYIWIGLFLSCFACTKNKAKFEVPSRWIVSEFKPVNSATWQKASNLYILSFTDSRNFNLGLDINQCMGKYKAGGSSISFSNIGCTEACCDTPLATNVMESLKKIKSYQIQGETMTLIDRDSIRLTLLK